MSHAENNAKIRGELSQKFIKKLQAFAPDSELGHVGDAAIMFFNEVINECFDILSHREVIKTKHLREFPSLVDIEELKERHLRRTYLQVGDYIGSNKLMVEKQTEQKDGIEVVSSVLVYNPNKR